MTQIRPPIPATTTEATVTVDIESQSSLVKKSGEDSSIIAPPIDNHNLAQPEEVILLDISWNKEWISYITHNNNTKCYYLTIRNFEEMDLESTGQQKYHHSIDISTHMKEAGRNHCKFLSVSSDGKYVAISFFERNSDGSGRLRRAVNPDCLIFQASLKGIKNNPMKIKNFQGRAVFLNRKKRRTLALIDLTTIQVYDNFPSYTAIPSYWFDLEKLGSTGTILRENVVKDKYYIKNVSWMSTGDGGTDNEMDRLMTYSRHIRHNVLVTPFTNGGVVRVWSMIEDGVRLTSFPTVDEEYVMAFSKDYKYTATYIKGTQSVNNITGDPLTINIYNVKSGLLVYKLKSRRNARLATGFEVSHMRFCYDARYLAMAGVETIKEDGEDITKVVFEVWYIEDEQSIYCVDEVVNAENVTYKTIRPFVARGEIEMDQTRIKCLKGFYITLTNGNNNSFRKPITKTVVLNIDEDAAGNNIEVKWIGEVKPEFEAVKELENNLGEFDGLRCANIHMDGKKYLVRFGKHMVQLWQRTVTSGNSQDDGDGSISEKDRLIYIRAYKGPNYCLEYSFREPWMIHNFESIKFINGTPCGRMIVNITETMDNMEHGTNTTYHTEEIFLPFDQLRLENAANRVVSPTENGTALATETSTQNSAESEKSITSHNIVEISTDNVRQFNYHQLESACQAMHHLHAEHISTRVNEKGGHDVKKWKNIEIIYSKTREIAVTAVAHIDERSNFFSTIAGSRTLAMLASFEDGRSIIKRIVAKKVPISIFSYPRSISQMMKNDNNTDEDQEEDADEKEDTNKLTAEITSNSNYSSNNYQSSVVTYRSSEAKKGAVEKCKSKTIATNENILTVLIDELEYKLYKLLFNRILSDSKELGPGCLSALTDALLFLQEEGNTDVLLTSSQKLSYLEIPRAKLCILESEIDQVLKVKALQKEYISSLRNLESHATMEQIKKHSGYFSYGWYKIKASFKDINRRFRQYFGRSRQEEDNPRNKKPGFVKKALKRFWRKRIRQPWRNVRKRYTQGSKKLTKVCVVPLPHFNSYGNFPEDRPKNIIYNKKEQEDDMYVIPYKDDSAFTRVASDQNSNSVFRQGDTIFEVLLEYKWNKFAMWRFWLVICAIHAIYYITYATGVLFSQELYGFKPGESSLLDDGRHLASIVLMCGAGATLMGQEIHQFWYTPSFIDYFSSGYNLVDIFAFIFPIITLLQLLLGWDHLNEVSSVTTLILWTHAILRLRVVSYFGITLETIIQLSKTVRPVLFIMVLIVFAFTQSFMVLLRQQDDTYFQETYNGTFYDTSGAPTAAFGNATLQDISSSNSFYDVYKSFSRVWFFIYGVWDPITGGDAGDDKMIIALAIAFSLATSLIFMNIVVALMTNTIEEVKARGKRAWVSHFAAVVSEIELFWCHKGAKYSRENNPTYIYYIANYDAVKKHEETLKSETKELEEALGIRSKESKCCLCGA